MSNVTAVNTRNCSVGTCPIETSYYGYVPNLGINVFFAIIYGLVISTCGFLMLVFRRSWMGYTVFLAVGTVIECAGYILRTRGHNDPWDLNPFVIQFVFLTIAPIFMSASVYLSLEYIAQAIGRGFFNINPNIYPRVFVFSDVVALIVQSVGGAMSTDTNPNDSMPVGVKITIVGLVLQLVSLCVFAILFLAIVIPHRKSLFSSNQGSTIEWHQVGDSPTSAAIEEVARKPSHAKYKIFLIVILVATVLIVVRSAYRVAELSNGLQGSLETNQWAFMIMDGLLILAASSLLAWGHPNLTRG